MILNGKRALNFLRVSPRLLVCGLEGDTTYSFRGEKDYVDQQEQALRSALRADNVLALNSSDPFQELARHGLIANEEPLELPFYPTDRTTEVRGAPVVDNTRAQDCEDLPLPQYDESRFKI